MRRTFVALLLLTACGDPFDPEVGGDEALGAATCNAADSDPDTAVTFAEVSTTASHRRPWRAFRSSLSRSPRSFSRSGNRPGRVRPRLNSVTS